jgi:hypothetical protein
MYVSIYVDMDDGLDIRERRTYEHGKMLRLLWAIRTSSAQRSAYQYQQRPPHPRLFVVWALLKFTGAALLCAVVASASASR